MFQKINDNLTNLLLCCIVFCVPLHNKIVPVCIILFALVSVISFVKNNYSINTINKNSLLIPIVFYVLHAISYFFSQNKHNALFDMEIKLSFIILPLCFLINSAIKNVNFYNVAKAFVIGCLVSSVICFYLAFINYNTTHLTSAFFYSNISYFHHPSYYGMYLCCAITLVGYYLYSSKLNIRYVLLLLLLLYFATLVVLLSSKSGLLLVVFIVFICFYYLIIKKIKRIYSVVIAVVIVSGVSFFVSNSYIIKTRVGEAFNALSTKAVVDKSSPDISSSQMRMYIWQDALTLIQQKPMGYTTGDVDTALVTQYIKSNNVLATAKHLNAHNQFLQTTLALGIVGLLVFITLLYYPLFKLKDKNWLLYLFFILIITINFLTESMLQTQAGIVFFVISYCLFVSLSTQRNSSNKLYN